VLAEIEEMARAVVAGNCEQERRRFSVVGRIKVEDYTCSVRDIPKFCKRPFGTRNYEPYSQRNAWRRRKPNFSEKTLLPKFDSG
jgi:hypothetical protein